MEITAKEYFDCGNELVRQKKISEAMIAFGHAIKEDSAYAEAYNNLGMLFRMRHELPEAEALLQRAIELEPKDAVSYSNLGLIYLDLYQLEKAELCLREAIRLRPKCAEFYNNLGLVYDEANNIKDAEAAYHEAIELKVTYKEAYYNLGILLKSVQRLYEAEIYLKKAVELSKGRSQALLALATLYLLQGRYKVAWELYDTFRLSKIKKRLGDVRLWQGEDLTGRRILLFYEQGFGDTLQFVRYVNKVSDLAAQVVLWVQPPLKKLFSYSFPSILIYDGDNLPMEQYDFTLPLMSLPKIFHTTEADIPGEVPYLRISEALAQKWRRKTLAASAGLLKVGLVWAGNPQHANDRNRSMPFELFKEILTVPGIAWFSLQAGKRVKDLQGIAEVMDYSAELTDFYQTAGLVKNLDLIISVDTAVAHLAGALGKETFILQPYYPDWRWQLDRTDSPWYPTVQLIRQEARGAWPGVIRKVIEELRRKIQALK